MIGVKVSNTFDREVGKKGWTQPMIGKNPGGILGILMKRINGVPHYLLQAKAEPGNIGANFNYLLHYKLQQAIY